jgi:hypothetical protein
MAPRIEREHTVLETVRACPRIGDIHLVAAILRETDLSLERRGVVDHEAGFAVGKQDGLIGADAALDNESSAIVQDDQAGAAEIDVWAGHAFDLDGRILVKSSPVKARRLSWVTKISVLGQWFHRQWTLCRQWSADRRTQTGCHLRPALHSAANWRR